MTATRDRLHAVVVRRLESVNRTRRDFQIENQYFMLLEEKFLFYFSYSDAVVRVSVYVSHMIVPPLLV